MRVLVTGGTGYLGGAIVRALHARGHVPVTFARHATGAGLPGVTFDGDVRDRTALRLAADGAVAIIHTAALVSLWRPDPLEFDTVNVGGLHNVLDVAGALGIRSVVYTSSFLALPPGGAGEPLEANDYQRTKVRSLELARKALRAGAPLAVLIPGVIYGPGAATEGNLVGRLIGDHRAGRLPGIIGADRLWSLAYVDDVANAHVAAIEQQGVRGEFVVGGENAPQIRIFEILQELTGTALPRRIPVAAARAVAMVEEARARWFGRPPLITRGVVEIFTRDWSMDSRDAVRRLSYRITPLPDGLKQVLA